MTTNDGLNKREQEQMSAAWARLEKQLQQSEQSPLWQQWETHAQSSGAADPKEKDGSARTEGVQAPVSAVAVSPVFSREQVNAVPLGRARTSVNEAGSIPGKGGAARRWLRRNLGKTAAACAAALITVVIATPSTNAALAAWLNTFRMDHVMVVNENDLESLLNGFLDVGESLETDNRFGSFERSSVGGWEELSPEQAAERLGFSIPAVTVAEKQTTDISSSMSQTLTLRLNVDEINSAMRRLGADKLLPESVDGKAITFHTGEGVSVGYRPNEGSGSEQSVQVTYVKEPSIDVDPTVDIKDAYEAVIRFPALPEHLRKSLQQAISLDKGEIPMPIITNETPEKVVIKGVDVYLEQRAGQNSINAIWLQDGIVANAYFNGYGEKQQIQGILAELIQS